MAASAQPTSTRLIVDAKVRMWFQIVHGWA
jgi:hypothetical protein